jgi:GTP pyrophosphokinase
MESLKSGLVADEVFVFTPKGEVRSLPAGSCPIDFAYNIHSVSAITCLGQGQWSDCAADL